MRTRSKSYPNNSNATIPRRQNRKRVPNIVEPEIRTIEEVVPMADRTMEELLQALTEGYGEAITTHLKNEISRFTQRFEETFGEAWERFKEMLRACPHHGFSELTQIDTFYNGLNEQDQDSLNAATGGNILIEIVNKQVITPATVKAVEKSCVTCGGAHDYYDYIDTNSNQSSVCATTGTYNQVSLPNQANNQMAPPGFAPLHNNQNRGDFNKQEENLKRNLNNDMRSILGSFFQNQALTSDTLLSNTIPNPKGEMKVVTTRSGLDYEGPSILTNSSLEKVVKRETEETTDKEQTNCQGSTAHIQPLVVPIPILEPDVPKTQPKPNIPYPSRLNDQKLHEKAMNQMEKFFQIFHDFHFDISFADALLLMPKFAFTIKSLLTNKDKLFELAKVPLNQNCSAMILKKLPMKLGDPGKFFIPCNFSGMDMNLELADRSITRPKGVAEDVFVKVGKFHFPSDFVVVDFEVDPRVPLILGRSFLRTGHVLINVYGEEITLQYNSKSGNPTLLFNPLFFEETKSEICKEPIVKSSSPTLTPFRESDFLLEEIVDFLKDELIPTRIEDFYYDPEGDILYLEKLLNDDPSQLPPMDLKQAEDTKEKSSIEEPPELELKELPSHLEYAFLEETDKLPPVVSLVHCVPKKGGMTVVANENNKLIPTRLVTGWRVCIDYRKLNDATRKDHFSLPFMDQMLERLAGNKFYCFLDGFFGYFQIPIDPKTKRKQLSHALMELSLTVACPSTSVMLPVHSKDKMLKRCEDTNLVLNWEKCHFMCKEGIVLGHKISNSEIEVDRAKVDVISKLSHPTAFKGVRSFLGHADKLDNALWAFRTTFKTPIGCTPYKLVYEKSCHLPVELEHKAYWALKHANFDLKTAGDHRKLQFNELNELRDQAYENSLIYKERTKKIHDSKIKNRIFNVGDQVLLFNSRLKIFSGKLKTRWSGPFTITQVFPYGTVELSQPDGPNFKVNGHRIKHYFRGDIPLKVILNLHTIPMEK
nr:reverse transcriptase domain-containing protein [Tanacetum cinerariifolium]